MLPVKTTNVSVVLIAAALCCDPAAGGIKIGSTQKFTQQIAVRNTTGQAVTFVRGETICASVSPDSFTVPAGGVAEITVEQKHWDTGLDNCYARNHTIAYDVENGNSGFRIQQYGSSNEVGCLDLTYFAVLWIPNAICPEAWGSVSGPVNYDANDPSAPWCPKFPCAPKCPDGAPYCPPSDDGSSVEYFGFAIENPQDFTVVLDNDINGQLDCNLTDLDKKTDRNECVTSQPTVGPSKSAITLKGSCGANFYRLSERTNVILSCYTSGTNGDKLQSWTPLTNGATYIYLNQ